uniref:Uncharacterized protein n=1 Tax=Heterorhabditis bacteriophora TaxID=37862 RepID=A0A1I7X535_HETBA
MLLNFDTMSSNIRARYSKIVNKVKTFLTQLNAQSSTIETNLNYPDPDIVNETLKRLRD